MAAAAGEKKFKDRLKKFLSHNPQKATQKRWKAMTKIIDKETPDNVAQFFSKNAEDIFVTLTAFFSTLESAKESEKHKKTHESECIEFQRILRLCTEKLYPMLKTKWKYKEMNSFLTKSLAKQNKHAIRKLALETLLIYIECMLDGTAMAEVNELLNLFAGVVNLPVFIDEIASTTGTTIRLKYLPPSVDDNLVICPTSGPAAANEPTELFAIALDHMASRVGKSNFDFWFDNIQNLYFVPLYPQIFKELGFLGQHEDYGFTGYCPHPLQQVLIEKIDAWKDNATICEMFWSDKTSPFVMEVFRQSCQLPITYSATIKRAIDLFKYFLITKRRANIVKDNLVQTFWRMFIQSVALVFTIDSTPAQSDQHVQLFQEAFAIFDMLTVSLAQQMEPATWKTLQYTLLDGTAAFLQKNANSKLSDNKNDIVRIADPLISYLFTVWIRSPITTPEMWKDFHDMFVNYTSWPHAIRQWKAKVLNLTEILCKFTYARTEFVMPTDISQEDLIQKWLGISNWTKESISDIWFTILNVAGNINEIQSPANYELAMRCVAEVVAMLRAGEASIPLSENPTRLPPLEVFFPWLMEACYATGEKIRGLLIAYQVLCQLFCTQHHKAVPPELVAHFYRAIQVGLRNENVVVRDHIMTEARHVFCYGLPGVSILIPDMITEVSNIFKVRQGSPPEVQKSAITLFNSLLCFANHYKDVVIPDVTRLREITSSELREALAGLLLSILNNQSVAPPAKVMNIWGACLFLYEELYNEAPRQHIIAAVFQALISLSKNVNDQIAQAAVEVLAVVSHLFNEIQSLDKTIIYNMLIAICENINSLMSEGLQTNLYREPLIAHHFEALAMWLSVFPNNYLQEKNIAVRVFQVIELGLLGTSIEPSRTTLPGARLKSEEDIVSQPNFYHVEQLEAKPAHNSPTIKNAAEMCHATIMNLLNNFPSPVGPQQLDSNITEDPDKPVMWFIMGTERIISAQEFVSPTNPQDRYLRIIMRDPMGRHAWMLRLDFEQPVNPRGPLYDDPVPLPFKSNQSEPKGKQADLLAALLSKFNEKHMDCLPKSPKFVNFTSPIIPSESFAAHVELVKASMAKLAKADEEVLQSFQEERPPIDRDLHAVSATATTLHAMRLFLSHMGYLNPASRRTLHIVEDTPEIRHTINKLDNLPARERMSFSVLNVASGQECSPLAPDEFLGNRGGSVVYNNFIDGLGWKVDIASHVGFKGGLTPDDTATAPYYADPRHEMLFHVTTTLNIDTFMRRIENDFVHIVWSEHKRDYTPVRFTTDVPDVNIVIYPLHSGLFRIQILRKDYVPPFGPLLNGMIVSKKVLPTLVRLTACSAQRRISRSRQHDFKHPYLVRAQMIRDVAANYKTLKPAEEFFAHLFPIPVDKIPANRPRTESFVVTRASNQVNRTSGGITSNRLSTQITPSSSSSSITSHPRTPSVSLLPGSIQQGDTPGNRVSNPQIAQTTETSTSEEPSSQVDKPTGAAHDANAPQSSVTDATSTSPQLGFRPNALKNAARSASLAGIQRPIPSNSPPPTSSSLPSLPLHGPPTTAGVNRPAAPTKAPPPIPGVPPSVPPGVPPSVPPSVPPPGVPPGVPPSVPRQQPSTEAPAPGSTPSSSTITFSPSQLQGAGSPPQKSTPPPQTPLPATPGTLPAKQPVNVMPSGSPKLPPRMGSTSGPLPGLAKSPSFGTTPTAPTGGVNPPKGPSPVKIPYGVKIPFNPSAAKFSTPPPGAPK